MGSKDALLLMVVVDALSLWRLLVLVAVGNDGAAASAENLDLQSDREIGEVGATKLDSSGRRCVRCVALSSEMNEVSIFA